MPVKKTYRKSKKAMSNSKRIQRLESKVNSAETKIKMTEFNEDTIETLLTSNGIPVINDMTQGDVGNTVDGSQYSLTGISYNFLVHNQTAVDCTFRFCIIRIENTAALSTTGESLFLQPNGNGLNFNSASATQRFYLPINHRKYDIIFQDRVKIGKSNSSSTSQYDNNQLINGYKKYKNKKESLNSSGNPDTKYQFLAWTIDNNFDNNLPQIELTGTTKFYFQDL